MDEGSPGLGAPIRRVTFPTTVPLNQTTQALIDESNEAIRSALGISDASIVFIESRNVGAFR